MEEVKESGQPQQPLLKSLLLVTSGKSRLDLRQAVSSCDTTQDNPPNVFHAVRSVVFCVSFLLFLDLLQQHGQK